MNVCDAEMRHKQLTGKKEGTCSERSEEVWLITVMIGGDANSKSQIDNVKTV